MEKQKVYEALKIWIVMLILCVIGLIMVYSASAYECSISEKYGYNDRYYLDKQAAYMAIALFICFCAQIADYRWLSKTWLTWPIYAIAIGMIFALKTSLGIEVNGATRWLRVGPVQLQVAEAVKIAVIIAEAYMLERFGDTKNRVALTLYMWIIGGAAAGLLLVISNDLSSAAVVLAITFGMSFIYVKTLKIHIGAALAVVAFAVGYVLKIAQNMPDPNEMDKVKFRVARIAAWIDPERYIGDAGYQTVQALRAIGRGGIIGKGLGGSLQKLGAIPEAQNDMIFSIFCEEFGLLGAMVLISLFVYLIYKMLQVIANASDRFGAALVTGVTLHVAVQVVINIGVNVNFFPNTGLALPFISYGGTAILCQIVEIALVLLVLKKCKRSRGM